MIAGFSPEGLPQLFLTDPAGTFSAWKANCIGGKNEKAVRELLEKSWTEGMTRDECVRLAIKSLLEVVDSGAKNMEIVVLKFKQNNEVSHRFIQLSVIVSCFYFYFIFFLLFLDRSRGSGPGGNQ